MLITRSSQWNCQRIIWREHPTHPLREYWLSVVTYGLSSSVHNSVRAMKQCAEEFPKAAQVVHDDFYVNDCFTGADATIEAVNSRQSLCALLQRGGFELAKLSSNNSCMLEAAQDSESVIQPSEATDAKALGLRWTTTTDELTSRVMKSAIMSRSTKREILSDIAQLYDPNGFLSPIIICAKIEMQEFWQIGTAWDDPVPLTIQNRWDEFYHALDHLPEVRFSHWFGTCTTEKIQFHGFADASANH